MTLGFFFNNAHCYGCKTCAMSCATTNLPEFDDVSMREVRTVMTDDTLAFAFVSMACNHCDDPQCLANCPVGAYTKLENGIVVQDHDACIGCQTCVKACPYGAPHYVEREQKVRKCDLCHDRLDRGELPACVEACPGANPEHGEIDGLKASHPDATDAIANVLPDPSITTPNLLVAPDPKLA